VVSKNRSEKNRRQRDLVAQRSAVAQGKAIPIGTTQRSPLHLPGLQPIYDQVTTRCDELAKCVDALDGELWVAGMWGMLQELAPDNARLDLVLLDLVTEAERIASVETLLLLRVLAVVGPAGGNAAASEAAERVTARYPQAAEGNPAWADYIGSVEVRDEHLYTDTFGEQSQLICEFEHSDRSPRHALVVTIEWACQGIPSGIGLFTDEAEIDKYRRELGRNAERHGGRFEQITAIEAATLLRSSVEAAADSDLPQLLTRPITSVSENSVEMSVLGSRMAAMADYGGYPPSAWPTSGWGAPPPPPRRGPSGVVALVVVVLLLSFGLVGGAIAVVVHSGRLATSGANRPVTIAPGVAVSPARANAAVDRGAVITVAGASQVLQAYWRKHEPALVRSDRSTLASLSTGSAQIWERGAVSCRCIRVDAPRPLQSAAYFVPRQTGYPAYFVVEAQTGYHGMPWAELLVFTKHDAGGRWLVAEDSGFGPPAGVQPRLGRPMAGPGGYDLPVKDVISPSQHRRAAAAAGQLAALWQQSKDQGSIQPTKTFVRPR
jgi:hypothetical protein